MRFLSKPSGKRRRHPKRHDRKRRLHLESLEDRALLAAAPFSEPFVIEATLAEDAKSVHATDLDGDGDQDVLSASSGDNKIAWYENRLDEPSADFGLQQVITTNALRAYSVFAADLDNDGDQDVLSASSTDDKVAWYENRLDEPSADFGPQLVITTLADSAVFVVAADLDGDGDQDVLSASRIDDKIAWYENRLNQVTADFGPQQVITTSANRPHSLFTADLDSDGDQDLLSASFLDDKIAWYENRLDEPAADFGLQQVLTTGANGALSVYAADLDGDGDPDVLSASSNDDKVAWYENRLDQATTDFGPQQSITLTAEGAYHVVAADLDGDGDQDAISASTADNKIAWYENRLGEPSADFAAEQVISTDAESPRFLFATDLHDDGDQDILSASSADGKIAWYRNERIGPLGDMDLDNDIDLDDVDDFVQALVDPDAYRSDHGGLSPAARGDIDGDGELDLDDTDGFVDLLVGPATGGGQGSTTSSPSQREADAPQHDSAASATPLESTLLGPTVSVSPAVANVGSTGTTFSPFDERFVSDGGWIAHAASQRDISVHQNARDAVFATMGNAPHARALPTLSTLGAPHDKPFDSTRYPIRRIAGQPERRSDLRPDFNHGFHRDKLGGELKAQMDRL